MRSKKKMIKRAKAKQKQEDSKLLPIQVAKNVNRYNPSICKMLKFKNIKTFDLHNVHNVEWTEKTIEIIIEIFGITTWNKYLE